MTRYQIGDFGGNWLVAELRDGFPTAFASVEKGWSTIFSDSDAFGSDGLFPKIGFSVLEYKPASRAMLGCRRKSVVEVSGGHAEIIDAHVSMESDPEFRRYLCL